MVRHSDLVKTKEYLRGYNHVIRVHCKKKVSEVDYLQLSSSEQSYYRGVQRICTRILLPEISSSEGVIPRQDLINKLAKFVGHLEGYTFLRENYDNLY